MNPDTFAAVLLFCCVELIVELITGSETPVEGQEDSGIDGARCVCTHSQHLAEITDNEWLTHPAVQTFGLPGRLHSLEMTVPFTSSVFLLEEGLQQLTWLLAATCCTCRLYSSFNSGLESSTKCTKHFTEQRIKMWFLP